MRVPRARPVRSLRPGVRNREKTTLKRQIARTALILPSMLALLVLLLVTRWGFLSHEVIDWDESTFIIVAADILRGGLPYVDTLDNKPPLQPFLLAGAMLVFGETLVTVRVLGAVALTVAAIALAGIARRVTGPLPAIMAAALLVVLASIPQLQPTLTEHLALAFLMPALLLLTGPAVGYRGAFMVGMLMMAAALCRSNLGLVALAGLVLVALPVSAAGLRRALAYGLGMALPLAAFALIYLTAGQFDRLVLGMVRLPAAYAADQTPAPVLALVVIGGWFNTALAYPLIWAPVTLAALAGIIARPEGSDAAGRTDRAMLVAGFAVFLSMALSGDYHRHHLLQLAPFVLWFAIRAFAFGRPGMRRLALVLALGAVVAALIQNGPATARLLANGAITDHHPLRRIAAQIAAERAPDDDVLALDGTLIYWYLGLAPPIPAAVHPSNLLRPATHAALHQYGETGPEPLRALLAARPRYVLITEPLPWYLARNPEAQVVVAALEREYEPWLSDGPLRVLRLR